MTKQKTTKKTLLTSVLSLVLCMAMLIGTTFAWFTDSATSKGNKIVSGDLNIKLKMWTDADTAVEITENSDPIFGGEDSIAAKNDASNTLWEPGKTQVVYLSLENVGSLDLKYQVAIDVKDPADDIDLYEVMKYSITPNAKFGEVTAWSNGLSVVPGTNATDSNNVALASGAEHFFALSVHMDEDAGNEYMNGSVEFDIRVLAAQLASELDSFGSSYDALATYDDGAYLVASSSITKTVNEGETAEMSNDDSTFKVSATAGSTGKVTATIDPTSNTDAVLAIVGANGKSLLSYDINVDGQADDSEVTVDLFVGKNLTNVAVYHDGVAMDPADYSYSATTGYVTITTSSFSPFEIAFHYADNVPLAKVTKLDIDKVNASYAQGDEAEELTLDIGYLFEMMQTAEEAAASEYAKYHADFVLSVDKDVQPEAVALMGYYELWCETVNKGNWLAMKVNEVVPKDTEIRLLQALFGEGASINYEELGQFVEAFRCGATKLDDSAIGTTLTVELRLYEVKDKAESENNSWNEETGEYLTVCTYAYTFK